MKNRLLEFYSTRKALLDTIESSQIDKSVVYDREFGFCKDAIMLIGEAPGESEAREGRPFCGAAGKNLSKLLEHSGLNRSEILITNAFAFRTFAESVRGFKNRAPNPDELRLGASMLMTEIKIVAPKVIVLLGTSAEKAMQKIEDESLKAAFKAIQKHEIKEIEHQNRKISLAKTHHPSPLVFNRADKRAELYSFFETLREHTLR